jgi:hypothetical protein
VSHTAVDVCGRGHADAKNLDTCPQTLVRNMSAQHYLFTFAGLNSMESSTTMPTMHTYARGRSCAHGEPRLPDWL